MRKTGHMSVGQGVLMLLFPPKCVGCGELMPLKDGMTHVFCPFCRTKWEAGRLDPQERILSWDDSVCGLVSVVGYTSGKAEGIPERLIYHLKHKDESRVFKYAAREMWPLLCDILQTRDASQENILITYPPRRRSALVKEGFDQARRLAEALSKLSGWPVETLLERTLSGRRAQKKLNAEARAENAVKAYRISRDVVELSNTTVILVDDLYTTGATLRTCADLLIETGAARVILATLGRTKHHSG